ncbi:hypothetical protein GCM10010377_76610 [Streptomyces viridiviolaceus]|nr:hypothetical protein GCM10010377_76610 [Streptomyces viridiviolaceus]
MPPSPDPTSATEPVTGEALANRKGYDERSLGPSVPLPLPADPAVGTVVLPSPTSAWCFVPTDGWPRQRLS